MSPRREKRQAARQELIASAKKRPRITALYVTLRALVVIVMVPQALNGNWDNVLWCVVTLVLFMIPSFLEHRIKIDVPDTLEVVILFFIFAAEILGEIAEFYHAVPRWDTMLHTANGFLAAAVGFALIDILNREKRFSISLTPLFVAIFAFCFSMTIGVLWEFFEFFMDTVFGMDMQKDTIYKGILDIGLHDTMWDLIVNFIGASVFSTLGYFYIKHRGENRSAGFVRRFMLTKIGEPDDEISENTNENPTTAPQSDEPSDATTLE